MQTKQRVNRSRYDPPRITPDASKLTGDLPGESIRAEGIPCAILCASTCAGERIVFAGFWSCRGTKIRGRTAIREFRDLMDCAYSVG